jgi:hypothetical protein
VKEAGCEADYDKAYVKKYDTEFRAVQKDEYNEKLCFICENRDGD